MGRFCPRCELPGGHSDVDECLAALRKACEAKYGYVPEAPPRPPRKVRVELFPTPPAHSFSTLRW